MHDWHSHAYAHGWIGRQLPSKERERASTCVKLVHLLPFDPDDEIRVLDIGAGYGATDQAAAGRLPALERRRPRLRRAHAAGGALYLWPGASDHVSYARGDLLDDDWTKDIAGKFDAVISSIAIHNVRYPQRIRAVYREVFDLLVPGGCFYNVDYVTPSSDSRCGPAGTKLMDYRYRIRHETGRWESLDRIEAGATIGAVQAPGRCRMRSCLRREPPPLAPGSRLPRSRMLLARRFESANGSL